MNATEAGAQFREDMAALEDLHVLALAENAVLDAIDAMELNYTNRMIRADCALKTGIAA